MSSRTHSRTASKTVNSGGPTSRSGSTSNKNNNNNSNNRSPSSTNNRREEEDPLLLAFERGRVDEERCNLEQKSIAIRAAFNQDASDIQMAQEDEKQKIEHLKSDYSILKRKLQVVQAENNALVQQITESEESLEQTRKELCQIPGSPLHPKTPTRNGSPLRGSGGDGDNSNNNEDYSALRRESDVDTALLAQLHVAEQRVSDLRGEHSALVEASTEISKRLREAATHRDTLAAEVGQLRDLDTRLKELNRNSATSEAEKLQKAHARLVEALNALKDRTTAAANERKFLATHLLEGAKERAMSLKEVFLRCAGGVDHVSQFLRSAVDENVTLRRKSRQAMVDSMDERELLQEYVLVLMARIAEATQRLHRDLYDAQVASTLKENALSTNAIEFYSAQEEQKLRNSSP